MRIKITDGWAVIIAAGVWMVIIAAGYAALFGG